MPWTDRPRWQRLLACLLAGLLLGVLGYFTVRRTLNGHSDFSGNYQIWRANLSQPFQPGSAGQIQGQRDDPDAYPPITYVLYAPLALLPLGVAAGVWYVINLLATAWLLRSVPDERLLPDAEKTSSNASFHWRNFWLILLLLPPWLNTILLGQNTLVLMALVWGALQASDRLKDLQAGGLLGLATCLKVLPAIFLWPAIVRRRWKPVLVAGGVVLLLVFGLGSAYFGPRTNWEFHQRWLRQVSGGSSGQQPDPLQPDTVRGSLRYHNQSWEAVSARWVMPVPLTNSARARTINVITVSASTWRTIYQTGQIVFLVGTCLALWGWRSAGRYYETASFLAPSMLLLSPIVWSHYFVWLLFPLLLTIRRAISGEFRSRILLGIWLAALIALGFPLLRGYGAQFFGLCLIWGEACLPCWRRLAGGRTPQPAE